MGHIYFTDDGDVAAGAVQQQQPSASQPAAAAAAPSVSPSTSTRFAVCCSRARVSYNDADPTYVFKACRSPDNATAATSLSNNSIKVYSCGPAGLGHAGDIPAAHQATISDIQFALPDAAHALYSCSRDGHVKAWDLRSRQQAESYRASSNEELFSFSVSDNLIAAGGQGNVLFWDRRTQQQLATFDDMHMDDVTQVLFHPPTQKLITASEDGLVAVHDVSAGLNQDDGFIAALNVGTSVSQLGLYGPGGRHMWCRTGTETLQLWDWLLATDDSVAGGDVAAADLTEAREMAAAAAAAAAAAGSSAAGALSQVDYLIACHFDEGSQQLLLLAGSIEGAVGFWPIAEQQHRAGQLAPGANMLLPPAVVLQGCHRDIVRSVDCFSGPTAQRLLCVTAGEDAQLGLWTLDEATAAAAAAGAASSSRDSVDSAGPRRHHKGAAAAAGGPAAVSSARRRSPY